MSKNDKINLSKMINPKVSGFAVLDERGNVRQANSVFKGLVREAIGTDIVGKPISLVIPVLGDKSKITEGVFSAAIGGVEYYVIPTSLCDDCDECKPAWVGLFFVDVSLNNEILSRLNYEKSLSSELEEILEGSFDGILVTDKDGKVLYVNDSYERVAEIKKSEIEGRYMSDLINPVWMPNSVAYIVAEQKTTVSKRQVVKSGRHIMVTGRPIFEEGSDEIKKIVINARDITEIYDLTEELQRSKSSEKLYMERLSDLSDMTKTSSPIIAVSRPMKDALSLAKKVANFQATVLILGESGVGKEEIAKFIHNNSVKKDKPFIAINCGAIPDNLLESELFGYEKGAFSGAVQSGKEGLFEAAEGGTVFLDEIGETPLDFQVKLLRFLETKEIRRVGSTKTKSVDVRVLAATNRNLEEMIEAGTFREDLYYRLNVVQIEVPPLRKRKDDVMPLASFFIQRYNKKYNQEKVLTSELVEELEKHEWTGNVRELKNVIENMVIVSNNEYLQLDDLPWAAKKRRQENQDQNIIDSIAASDLTLAEATEELEKQILQKSMNSCKSTREMAEKLKVNQSTIVRKLQKYRLK
jgi:PAS domain S-box-containing protein/TyrR family helix-turn-helix protein